VRENSCVPRRGDNATAGRRAQMKRESH
jgi:hypothetical protein